MGQLLFKLLSVFIGLFGVFLYLFMVRTFFMVTLQMDEVESSFLEQIGQAIVHVVFLPGLPHVILAVCFLLMEGSYQANKKGLFHLVWFIPFHFFTASVIAHGTVRDYIPWVISELAISVYLIYSWKKVHGKK